jgi:hypothetical protein
MQRAEPDAARQHFDYRATHYQERHLALRRQFERAHCVRLQSVLLRPRKRMRNLPNRSGLPMQPHAWTPTL